MSNFGRRDALRLERGDRRRRESRRDDPLSLHVAFLLTLPVLWTISKFYDDSLV